MKLPKWLPLLLLLHVICGVSARTSSINLQSQYLRAMGAYRRLERSLPPQELRALTGLGLLNGARQAEQQMEQHLVQSIKELLLQTDLQQAGEVLPKIDQIEQQLARDKRALNILSSAMDVLSSTKNEKQFRHELRELLHQRQQQRYNWQLQLHTEQEERSEALGERLGQLRLQILQQVPQMKQSLETKIDKALEHIVKQAPADGPLAKASLKVLQKREVREQQQPLQEKQAEESRQEEQESAREPTEMRVIKSILTEDDFRENLVEQQFERSDKKQVKSSQPKDEIEELANDNVTAKAKPGTKTKTSAKQEDGDGFSELDDGDDIAGNGDADGGGGGGGGGLVGIIGSLSGGEGGSDVGALIGALTGLISTLFGPGGLDIDSLISTATSLLAGLLAGNQNFGTVLGQYVGTALDGLSGGGGAINNGQFLGNFLGTVLAALSADPEDEGPPQPLTFTKSFLSSFIESKFRQSDASEERHGSAELPHAKMKEAAGWHSAGGFDSGGFVKQIASHLVSSALGLLLNASLGAASGASHASTGLFASSSSSSHHMKPAGHRSWEQL